MKLVEMNNIKKVYNAEKKNVCTVLNNLSLDIEEGEMVAIMGSSGSGKSTLLHILGCLDTQTEGQYLFRGKNVDSMNWDEKATLRNEEIGFVLQDFGLIEYQTVLDNLLIPLYFNSGVKKSQMRSLCLDTLCEVGMEGMGTEKVNTLSGGEKQRIAIARALINQPSLILADEPTGSLDHANSERIMELLKTVNKKGNTIIIVTHDNRVAAVCDRQLELIDGVLQPVG